MKKTSILFFALGMFFTGTLNSSAESLSGGFSITPFLKEIELSSDHPEESFPVEIRNDSAFPVNIKLSVADFGSMDETGGVLILDPKINLANKYSLAPWMSLEKDTLQLGAGEEKTVNVRAINKENLTPGGHYGVILADIENISGESDEKASNIALNSRMTSLIFLRKMGGEMFGLDLKKNEEDAALFSLPRKAQLTFGNTGNVHAVPRGLIRVVDPMGREVSRGIINNESKIILPESSRVFPIDLFSSGFSFIPGEYRLITQYRYEGKDEFVTSDEKFFFFPPISCAILAVVFLIGAYFILRRSEWKKIIEKSKAKTSVLWKNLLLRYAKPGQSRRSKRISPSGSFPWKKTISSAITMVLKFSQGVYQKMADNFHRNAKKLKKSQSQPKGVSAKDIFWTPKESVASKTPKYRTIDKAVKKKKKHKSSSFSFGIMIVIAIIIGALLLYFYNVYFQGPVSGKITVSSSAKMSNENTPLERFESIYFSFHHSPAYKVNSYDTDIKENNNILERALLSQGGNKPSKIAFTAEEMDKKSLTDMADYNLRKKNPKTYTESKFDFGGISGVSFSANGENTFEKTNFIMHDNKLVEFSFSGSANNEVEISKESEDVIRSIQWKK